MYIIVDMYALKRLYLWLMNVCSVIFICGLSGNCNHFIFARASLSLSPPSGPGAVSWDASHRMWSGDATFGFGASRLVAPTEESQLTQQWSWASTAADGGCCKTKSNSTLKTTSKEEQNTRKCVEDGGREREHSL